MSEHVCDQQDVERAAAARDQRRIAALEAALEDAARQMEHLRDIDNNDDGEVARKAGAYAHTIRERLRNGTAALDAMLERAVREGMTAGVADFRGVDRESIAAIIQRVKETATLAPPPGEPRSE